MTYQRRGETESNIYHIMSRGVGGHLIFEDDRDRNKYLALLGKHLKVNGIDLYAWCLMGNHVHLVVHGPLSSISTLMRDLGRAYVAFFNERHERHGHLMQGRFKSVPIADDEQLVSTVRYVHLNPTEAAIAMPAKYPWSSYGEYMGAPRITDTRPFLNVVGGKQAFEELHRGAFSTNGIAPRSRTHDVVPDEEALEILLQELCARRLIALPLSDKPTRDNILIALRKRGLSIRQIERVTGVSRGIIANAKER